MKSVQQELRVDSNKQQLLESRMKPLNSFNNIISTSTACDNSGGGINVNGTNNLNNLIEEVCKNEENSSSSACCLTNNSIMNVSIAAENSSNTATNKVSGPLEAQNDTYSSPNRQITNSKRKRRQKIDSPHSKKLCSRPEKRIDEIFKIAMNKQASQVLDSIQTTAHTKPTVSQTHVSSPHRNSGTDSSVDSCQHNTDNQNNNNNGISSIPNEPSSTSNNNNNIPPSIITNITANSIISSNTISTPNTSVAPLPIPTASVALSNQISMNGGNSEQLTNHLIQQSNNESVMEMRRKVEDLERLAEDRAKEVEQLRDKLRLARDSIVRCLVSQTETERREARDKLLRDSVQLGSFKAVRQGALVEERWVPGQLYTQLEAKRERLEQDRDGYERDRKLYQRSKKSSSGNSSSTSTNHGSISVEVHQQQADILDGRKNSLNKRDKELQESADRLDRDRLIHIRETKRIQNEEGSRFRKFPILHERYLMLSLLGKGGFSEVFKAFDLDKFSLVACKVHELNSNWPQEKKDSYIRHALREIEIHKKLQHPRIVSVLDVFNIDSDAFCTVMEYCEGSDLDFFLKHNRSLPEKEARCIISQVVSALRYLNDRRNPVIHYDLKPGNILLCRRDCQIKITDFGLSKIFPDDRHDGEDGMELTSQGAGTYWYLPPECFVTDNGPPTISNKVDVWSVGVIFYQCLYGKKPFGDNETQTDILHNNTILQARSINFPTNPKVSDVAKDFIRKCCTYRKELRPDVFQLYNDDYLKSKTQLKYAVDIPSLPGPTNNQSNASGSI